MKPRRRRFAAVIVAAVLAAATVPACSSSHPSPPPLSASTATHCGKPDPANPVFSHTSGNHLIDTRGQVMIPYGITVFGLSVSDWQAQQSLDRRQIAAAITTWCTNYVRLMVAPANLLTASGYDAAYLAEVRSEVQLVLSYGNNVILVAQTERVGSQSPNPTQQTLAFWQVLAPIYEHDPRVWFDVFNEPRLKSATPWDTWQAGGTVNGQRYIGMQQLVTAVRAAAGDTNLILVEGPAAASTLGLLSSHPITGANLAFAVHPYGQQSQAEWNSQFGQEAGTVPVIADEWSTSSLPRHGSCRDPATWVPKLFAYLRAKQIGLGGWGLVPGVLITSTATFTPTRLSGHYTCLDQPQSHTLSKNATFNGSHALPQAQGIGQLLQQYFARYARS